MSLQSIYNEVLKLQQYAVQQDKSGGAKRPEPWADVAGYTNIACSLQPASGSTMYKYRQRQLTVSHTVYTDQPLNITGRSRVVINGKFYVVMGSDVNSAGRYVQYTTDVLQTL